ncbi:hypothetical protein Dimus_004915 [Dionaea muscipula]
MACSKRNGFSLSGSASYSMTIPNFGSSPASFGYLKPRKVPALGSSFCRQRLAVQEHQGSDLGSLHSSSKLDVKPSFLVPKAQRWWEKTMKPNMVEITSAQELVDSLKNAGDRLVVVGFYSPGCGGCRSLHPKVSQLAETHPDAIFLQINHQNLNRMSHALHVHVLPFFRFYRGTEGRVCSFSCTIATIKKFKDALAKYGTPNEKYFLGPAKGLEHSELMKLAMIREISVEQIPVLPSLSLEEEEEEEMKIEELVKRSLQVSENPLISSFVAANEVEAEAKAPGPAVLVA